ncbi:MAG: AMP-binding protein [Spirochaetales bacterium]
MTEHETLPKRYLKVAEQYPDMPILYCKNAEGTFDTVTYKELWKRIKTMAAGLKSIGIKRGEHVGMMSDNRPEWIITDLALLCLGAADVPRGSDSTAEEMAYILDHADCAVTIAENWKQAEKILSKKSIIPKLNTLILFDGAGKDSLEESHSDLRFFTYQEVFEAGEKALQENPLDIDREIEKGDTDDLVTIIYTSGTTGEPKGVMLHHRSYIFQLEGVPAHIDLHPGEIFISILPIWHSFERAVEYFILDHAAAIAYSKPVGKILLEDMAKVRPQWMASVPRIWEGVRSSIYRKVNSEKGIRRTLFHFFVGVGELYGLLSDMLMDRMPQFVRRSRFLDITLSIVPWIVILPFKILGDILVFKAIKEKLGGRFIAGVSGGGALPPYVDRFFRAAGVLLLEGYGLTEAGPILSVRKQNHPVIGTIGPLLPGVEYKVVDEAGNSLPPNHKGVLHVKSPQIMLGYYKKPEVTAEVVKDGWLNTGDLAIFTHKGECKIVGRAKETIVLLGGENIEPTPIEETLVQSDYIEQAMVVGQDKKFLGALIVPNMEKLEAFAAERGISYVSKEELLDNPEVQEQIHDEIQRLVNPRNGFKVFERIYRFKLLPKPFEVGRELTNTLKIRRNVVQELYKKEIDSLFY